MKTAKTKKLLKNFKTIIPVTLALVLSLIPSLNFIPDSVKAAPVRRIVFPVVGPASYSNDYNAPRASGPHHAIDIIAGKRQKLVAAVNGTVSYVAYPQPSYGYYISIRDNDGYRYNYVHINNDNPGTDDGRGGAMNAYAPYMREGNKVIRGQHIGWVGDSGNAENTVPHLHFEIIAPNGNTMNPYNSLLAAKKIGRPITAVTQPYEVLPYGNVKRSVNLAMGNFDLDAESEYVSGQGKGGTPRIKVYGDNHALLAQFMAYSTGFRGGVDVAIGDVDGDTVNEIIAGTGPNGGAKVRVFELDGTAIGGFYAYPGFKGRVNVAAGDVDGDGTDEIITGAGPGGSPRVRIFELDGTAIGGFFAYTSRFRGGVDVASADVAGLLEDEIITGAGPGGVPIMKVFDINRTVLASKTVFASNFRGGIRVSAGNVRIESAKAEIIVVPDRKGVPLIRMYEGNGAFIDEDYFMERWWLGYNEVAAGFNISLAGTGVNRRAAIMPGAD